MRPDGFTLLEILIALVILALAAQAVVAVFSDQTVGIVKAERMQRAVGLAKNTLDRLGKDIPLRDGLHSGTEGRELRWQIQISPYQRREETHRAQLYSISVMISDGEARSPIVDLKTLRIGVVGP